MKVTDIAPVWIDVCGPLKSKHDAEETMRQMGESNHAVYSRNDGTEWFVERNTSAMPDRIFGMTWGDIQSKQMGER